MTVDARIIETTTVMGFTFPVNVTVSSDGGIIKTASLAAAKVGQLTTRDSASEGELTMVGGHGITTGDRLDVYWAGGARRGITVGTVSTNQVPLTTSTGAGDDLPANLTAVTAMVPHEEEFIFTGDNAEFLGFYSQRRGTIVLAEADETEAAFAVMNANVSQVWIPERDVTVPTASMDVTKAYFSHADSANTGAMRVAVLFS